jgi:hypothetical protein
VIIIDIVINKEQDEHESDKVKLFFDISTQYLWKEFRFMFEKEANDVEMFCNQLVVMEQDVINKVSAASGLN